MTFKMTLKSAKNIREEQFVVPPIIRNSVIIVTAPNFQKATEEAEKKLREFFPGADTRGRGKLSELYLDFNILEIEL